VDKKTREKNIEKKRGGKKENENCAEENSSFHTLIHKSIV